MAWRYGGDPYGNVEAGALVDVDDTDSKHGEHAGGGRLIFDDEALAEDL